MTVKVYFTSVSSSREIKGNQDRIFSVLDSKKIAYEAVDISQDSKDKEFMRLKSGNPSALPPQIFNGDVYCGDYTAFDNAVECDNLEGFLKL